MFNLIGFSRRDWSNNDLKEYITEVLAKNTSINPTKEQLTEFLSFFKYQKGDFSNLDDFKALGEVLGRVDDEWKTCSNKLYYLAAPPQFYEVIFEYLSKSGLTEPCGEDEGWTRVIVEKPFGRDLKTAQALDNLLSMLFKEEQIYRVDHYLGKEMSQNIMAFRFYNNLLEKNWNKDLINKIEIKVTENFGIEGRGNFFDGVGAFRDVGQNHLLQMLALVTMADPVRFTDEAIRQERAKVLKNLKVYGTNEVKENTYRAQYAGYTDLDEVESGSKTETYFKVRSFLNVPDWKDVPIILEHGKQLSKTDKKIIVHFAEKRDCQNRIVIDLEGEDAGIYIEFWAKKPGYTMELDKRVLSFSLCEEEGVCGTAEEYERLLSDCIEGNQTLFVSTEEVEAMWRFVDPIVTAWNSDVVPLEIYEKGSTEVGKNTLY